MESSTTLFAKLRKDAAHIEQTMDRVEETLARPSHIFNLSKSLEAENIMILELNKATETSDWIKELKSDVRSNINEVSEFLSSAQKFHQYICDELMDMESQLESYGYRRQEGNNPQSMESGIDNLSLESSEERTGDSVNLREAGDDSYACLADAPLDKLSNTVRELSFSECENSQ